MSERYPYQDGDHIVLGPEIFTNAEGTMICWKGENYYPPAAPERGAEADNAAVIEALREFHHVEGEPASETAAVAAQAYAFAKHRAEAAEREAGRLLGALREAHRAITYIEPGRRNRWRDRAMRAHAILEAALSHTPEPEEREGLRDETRKFMAAVKARFRHMRENYRRFKKAMQDTDHE